MAIPAIAGAAVLQLPDLAEVNGPGWGVLLARTAAVVLKVGTGALVLAVGAWELMLR